MGTILAPMAILIVRPWLALAIGGVLIGLGRWQRRRMTVVAGALWLVYGCYETGMKLRWLCGGECNIRIDLLLIYPILLVAALLGAAALLWRRAPVADPPGTR